MGSLLRFLPFLGMALLVMASQLARAADPGMVKLRPQNSSGGVRRRHSH
jgi:hypothetical protein